VQLADQLEPRLLTDPFWPQLADRLATVVRAGIDITDLASRAAASAPLPDEMPAAALWWRLGRPLPGVRQQHRQVGRVDRPVRRQQSAALQASRMLSAGRRWRP